MASHGSLMIGTFDRQLKLIDQLLERAPRPLHEALAQIPLDVFALLYLDQEGKYPNLRRLLPPMPSAEVQIEWTGTHGTALMSQSCAFVKTMMSEYARHRDRPVEQSTVLDYGCGWGRLSRLMFKYVPPEQIWGADPWESSLDHCEAAGLGINLALVREMPGVLPFESRTFDLVFAFSIFTHLSDRCGKTVMRALRRTVKDDALLTITIRPPEYWDIHTGFPEGASASSMQAQHDANGFAFIPLDRPPIDGEQTFGDTSMTLDYIQRAWPDWKVIGTDLNLVDPYQVLVYLKPS